MPSHIVLNIGGTFLAIINTTLILFFTYFLYTINKNSIPIFTTVGGYVFTGISLILLCVTWFLVYKMWKMPYLKN